MAVRGQGGVGEGVVVSVGVFRVVVRVWTCLTRGHFLVGKFHSPSHHCPTKRSASFSTLELSTQGELRDVVISAWKKSSTT